MSARNELGALLDRAIAEEVAEAVAETNSEWGDWLKTGLAISYNNAGGSLTIQVFADDNFEDALVQITLLELMSNDIDAVSEMPDIADRWIATLEEVIEAFRDAKRRAA